MAEVEEHHVTDWLPAYVLDALAADEMSLVSEHLASCAACQAELARLQRVADELPLAVPQTNPPPALKARLMRSIHARQVESSPATRHNSTWQRVAAYFRGHLPAFGLAFIVLLVLGNVLLWRQLNYNRQVAGAPMRVVTLVNSSFSPAAVGTLVVAPNGQYCTLVVNNLAALDPSQQYQVWLIKGSEHTSAGIFTVNPDGYALLEILAPLPLAQYDAIGVSVEPVGGSIAPTGPNVFKALLTK